VTTPVRRAFTAVMGSRVSDEILIPRLRVLLTDPDLRSFKITMPRTGHRSPDGWFHPSTHPSWPERLLTYYLRASEPGGAALDSEVLDHTSTVTIAQGHWLHAYLQHVLLLADLVVVANPQGRDSAEKVEYPLVDEEHRSRGHADGLLNADTCGLDVVSGLELKSMNSFKLAKCPTGPARSPERVAWLVDTNPGYYLQAQEYMRMGGWAEQRLLIVAPSYPFALAEIAIPYDARTAEATAAKYARVLRAHADCDLPDPCCAAGSSEASSCPARYVCPVGQMR
jgi:hypothetical protein